MHMKLFFGALFALVFTTSVASPNQAGASGKSTPPEGLFLDHSEVLRQGGVGNYLWRYNPGPRRQLEGDKSIARNEGYGDRLSETEFAEATPPAEVEDTQSQQAGIAAMESALDKANSKLYFDPNSVRLKDGQEDVSRVGELLATRKNEKIEVNGFADRTGSDAYNLKLSRARAENVSQLLMKQGVPRDQIVIKAWGESRQVPDENNRRVELKLIEG